MLAVVLRRVTALSGLALTLLASCASPEHDGWIRLFDGESLTGWTPKIRGFALGEDPFGTFAVEDGVLRVSYGGYGGAFDRRFGHLFYEHEYSHYVLRIEYRFTGDQISGGPGWAWRNSGVMIHGQAAASMGIDQEFPVSIEVQLLGGDGSNERHNVNLCTPGTNVVIDGELDERHCVDSSSATCHGDDWYEVTVEVRGDELVRHFLGSELVLEYGGTQYDPRDANARTLIEAFGTRLTGGSISLQSESHPIEFRRVELKVLE